MISLDVVKLATDKSAEEALVSYVGTSINKFGSFPNHRWVSENYRAWVDVADVQASVAYFTGYKPVEYSPGYVRDESKFVYGTVTMFLYTYLLKGNYQIAIQGNMPGLDGSSQIFWAAPAVNPLPAGQVVRIDMPLAPYYDFAVSANTYEVGSTAGIEITMYYNGLYFSK